MEAIECKKMNGRRWRQALYACPSIKADREAHGNSMTYNSCILDGIQWADENPADTKWMSLDCEPEDGQIILVLLVCEKENFHRKRLALTQWIKEVGYQPLADYIDGEKYIYHPRAWRLIYDIVSEFVNHGVENEQYTRFRK